MDKQDNLSPQEMEEEVLPSLFESLRCKFSKPLPSTRELERLIRYDKMVEAQTITFRHLKEVDKTTADNVKRKSIAICPSILFKDTGRKLADFDKETLWLMLDYDDVPHEELDSVVAKACQSPYTMVCYRTISNRGLRILLRYEHPKGCTLTVTELHRLAIDKAMKLYDRLLNYQADIQCRDMTRLCGIAHDEHAFFRWNAPRMPVNADDLEAFFHNVIEKEKAAKEKAESAQQTKGKKDDKTANKAPATIEDITSQVKAMAENWNCQFAPGSHHEYTMRFATFCHHYGAKQDELTDYMLQTFGGEYDGVADIIKWVYGKMDKDFGSWHLYGKGERYGGRGATVKVIRQWLASHFEFRHNTITNRNELRAFDILHGDYYKWTEIDDRIINSLFNKMGLNDLRTSPKHVDAVINSDFTPEYNPLEEYLAERQEWHPGDTDYIKLLCSHIKVVDDEDHFHTQELFEYCFRKWFVSMVMGWVLKDSNNQTILLLVGRGGIFKTTFFEYLLPNELRKYFFNDSDSNYNSKDFLLACSNKALICLDEFDALYGKNLNSFKSCITKRTVVSRIPYDRYPTSSLRTASFCGTSNNIHIITENENRRYLVWQVKSIDNPRENPIDYNHLYAQALALGRQVLKHKQEAAKADSDEDGKEQDDWVYWLTNEDYKKQEVHNRLFLVNNYLEERILKFYRVPLKNTTDENAFNLLFVSASDILDKVSSSPTFSRMFSDKDITAAMNRLGFTKRHRQSGNGWWVIEKEGTTIQNESKFVHNVDSL